MSTRMDSSPLLLHRRVLPVRCCLDVERLIPDFAFPLTLRQSICCITKNSNLAKLLRDPRVRLIVIDEAPMLHRHIIKCLDRTLRDLPNSPFGGLVVVLPGDFGNVCPWFKMDQKESSYGPSFSPVRSGRIFTSFNSV